MRTATHVTDAHVVAAAGHDIVGHDVAGHDTETRRLRIDGDASASAVDRSEGE